MILPLTTNTSANFQSTHEHVRWGPRLLRSPSLIISAHEVSCSTTAAMCAHLSHSSTFFAAISFRRNTHLLSALVRFSSWDVSRATNSELKDLIECSLTCLLLLPRSF